MSSLKMDKRVLALMLFGVLVVVLFLYFFVDIGATISAILSANPLFTALTFFLVASGIFFYALTWEVILRALSKPLGIWRSIQYVCASIFVSILVPGGPLSEETTRTYLTVKNSDNSPGSVVASIISHRALYVMPFLGGACFSLILMFRDRAFLGYTFYVISSVVFLIVLALSLVLYLAVSPEKTGRILSLVFRLVGRVYKRPAKLLSWREKAAEELKFFHEGIDLLRGKPLALIPAFLCTVLSYASNVFAADLAFRALGTEVPLSLIIVAYTITVAILTLPLGILGMTGPAEISMITIYSAAGIHPATAAASTLIVRTMTLWFQMALGGLFAYRIGLKALKETA